MTPAHAISLPRRSRGRQSATAEANFAAAMRDFSDAILSIADKIPFAVSSRGWCYILEEHGLNKGDFDQAQALINSCRESGLLPLDVCAEDEARSAAVPDDGADRYDLEEFVVSEFESIIDEYETAEQSARYNLRTADFAPHAFWDFQPVYVEVLVEKIDLRSLFENVCKRFYVPLQNGKGWSDLNSRAAILRRMQSHQEAGRRCVLLYCGDHDPAGLNISTHLRANVERMNGCRYMDGTVIEINPDLIEFRRFGLNFNFIDEHQLSWIEGLHTGSGANLADPKHPQHGFEYVRSYLRDFGERKCEANALVTRYDAAQRLIKEALTEFIDLDAESRRQDENRKATFEARHRLATLAQERMGWQL